jgi:hypothetical protein
VTENERAWAIREAREWVAIRSGIRKHLIAEARLQHPEPQTHEAWESNEVRKLYQFPSDLSEARLLGLIDNPGTSSCIHPGIFDFDGSPTQLCTYCGNLIPREQL